MTDFYVSSKLNSFWNRNRYTLNEIIIYRSLKGVAHIKIVGYYMKISNFNCAQIANNLFSVFITLLIYIKNDELYEKWYKADRSKCLWFQWKYNVMKCLVNNIHICIRFAELILVQVVNLTSNLESYPDYYSSPILLDF